MIVSILHNIAQVPDLVDDLRKNHCLEVCIIIEGIFENYNFLYL